MKAEPEPAPPQLQWTDRLSVRVAEIDAQHQELFRRINTFLLAVHERRSRDEIEPLMEYLAGYARQHFADEERMMQFSGFPGLGDHLAEHERFLDDWQRLARQLADGVPARELARELVAGLCAWAEDHVAGSDQALGAWLSRWLGRKAPGPQA
jgi:hemerythrin